MQTAAVSLTENNCVTREAEWQCRQRVLEVSSGTPLTLESLHQVTMSDEPHRMAWEGDVVLAHGPWNEMTVALEVENTLKSPTSNQVREEANFFQVLGSSAKCHEWWWWDNFTTASMISDQPGCENGDNSKPFWREIFLVLGTVSVCGGDTHWK